MAEDICNFQLKNQQGKTWNSRSLIRSCNKSELYPACKLTGEPAAALWLLAGDTGVLAPWKDFVLLAVEWLENEHFLGQVQCTGPETPVLVAGWVTGEEPSGCLNFTTSSQRASLSLPSKAVQDMNILETKSRAKADSASAHQVCRNVRGP